MWLPLAPEPQEMPLVLSGQPSPCFPRWVLRHRPALPGQPWKQRLSHTQLGPCTLLSSILPVGSCQEAWLRPPAVTCLPSRSGPSLSSGGKIVSSRAPGALEVLSKCLLGGPGSPRPSSLRKPRLARPSSVPPSLSPLCVWLWSLGGDAGQEWGKSHWRGSQLIEQGKHGCNALQHKLESSCFLVLREGR